MQRKRKYGILAGNNPLLTDFSRYLSDTRPEIVLAHLTDLETIQRKIRLDRLNGIRQRFVIISGKVFDFDPNIVELKIRELEEKDFDSNEDKPRNRKRSTRDSLALEELYQIDQHVIEFDSLGQYFDRAKEIGLLSPKGYFRLIERIREEAIGNICIFGNSYTSDGRTVSYRREDFTKVGVDYVCLRQGFQGLADRIDYYVRGRIDKKDEHSNDFKK